MSPDLVALLRLAGVADVADERVNPRPGRFAPIGVMVHHTAVKGAALHSCKFGRKTPTVLPGPLCNINITRAGKVNVTTDGRANDSGRGSSVALADVLADRPITVDAAARNLTDDTDGSPLFYDIEVDNDGVGEPIPIAQLDALVAVCAALVNHFRWSPNRIIHHRQWTRRKTDMKWRGNLPALVTAHLNDKDEFVMDKAAEDRFAALEAKIDKILKTLKNETADGKNTVLFTKLNRIEDKVS